MKHRRIYWILLAALVVIALVVLLQNPWSTLPGDDRGWVLQKPGRIDRIVLRGAGDTVELMRSDTSWLLYGREEVNPRAIENLLHAGEHLEITSVMKSFAPDSTWKTVSVEFGAGGNVRSAYTLVMKPRQSVVVPSGSDRSYAVALPGFADLDLEKVFSAHRWRALPVSGM